MNISLTERISIIVFVALLFFQNGLAQTSIQNIEIPVDKGKVLNIQVCTDKIIRIRIGDKKMMNETLLERYGIIKTDWTPNDIKSKTEGNNQVIITGNCKIEVNKKTGIINITDNKGNTIIKSIKGYTEGSDEICTNLQQSLQKFFEKDKFSGGIIGDSSYTGNKKEGKNISKDQKPSVLEFSLADGELFYGGGATSRSNIQHRGEVLRMWATYQKTEIPMPFLMSSKGWGVFYNSTSINYFDIGRYQKDKLLIYNSKNDIDFYLMVGNNMPEVIDLYTTVTRRPYLLPKWAYGLAFGGNTMENQMDLMNDAVRFRDEKIPCDIFWIEPQWMAKNYDFSTSKNWNLEKFPAEAFWEVNNPKKYENRTLFVAKLHNLGFKLALWLCIDHDMSIAEEDYLDEKAGKPQSGQEHWFPHLNKFIDQGVDGFKLDPGRTLDEHPDRVYYNGFTDKEMHNLNQVLLPKQMYQTFREHKGIRSFHHYCGGYAGAQHWGASTSGDNGGGKDALFDQLNLGLSGFVNTSADVMEGIDDNKAGIHLGFFLPWIQVNSWYSLHHPWYLKPDEKETFRYYSQLRNSLTPYIYSAAIQGSQTGIPILRAMPLAFPDDRKVDNLIYQYMFGENLLVGVFSDSIYLPKGNWINYWNGEKVTGEKIVHSKIPENRGGMLFIKAGAIIPYMKLSQFISENMPDTLILKIYPEKNSEYTLLEDDGISYDYEKGDIVKTKFTCSKTSSGIEINIQHPIGKCKGMLAARVFELEIDTKSPKSILVNNKESTKYSFLPGGNLHFTVNRESLNEDIKININF